MQRLSLFMVYVAAEAIMQKDFTIGVSKPFWATRDPRLYALRQAWRQYADLIQRRRFGTLN